VEVASSTWAPHALVVLENPEPLAEPAPIEVPQPAVRPVPPAAEPAPTAGARRGSRSRPFPLENIAAGAAISAATRPDVDYEGDHTDEQGCRIESIAMQFGRVPCHADFARTFSGVRREFRVKPPDAAPVDFDARDRAGTLYEVKTGYGWLTNPNLRSPWRERRAAVIERFQEQAMNQHIVAERCGYPLVWYFNQPSVAEYFNRELLLPWVDVRGRAFHCQRDSDHTW
jgi:hypothetical protein